MNDSEDVVLVRDEGAGKYTHIDNDGAQVHIGLMTETVKPTDEDYYNARVAVSVLSGGMSARLFTEVREKRGLCYAIGATYHGLKEAAGIMCYAGTTPDKGPGDARCNNGRIQPAQRRNQRRRNRTSQSWA